MSCKEILRVANLFCELEIKLRVASCFMQVASYFLRVASLKNDFTSCKFCFMTWVFKNFILRVASRFLRVESSR